MSTVMAILTLSLTVAAHGFTTFMVLTRSSAALERIATELKQRERGDDP